MDIDKAKPGSFCWFELATSDQAAAKKLRNVGVNAGTADIHVAKEGNIWRFETVHPSGTVKGTCKPVSAPTPVPATLPQYGVVHHTGSRPVVNVLTFFGHTSAQCDIDYTVTGAGIFHRWLRDTPPALRLPATFQPGWHAIGGIYPRP